MTAIESKELKGFNLKNLISIIGATVTICAITLTSFNKLENKIDKMEMQNQGDEKYNELRIRTIEMNIQTLGLRIDKMESDKALQQANK